ncbi:hypothetical protein K458DRAFT_480896 [Lentithecium fluviatile CBS 122367]|uniref:Uncharacterized protein n=1 Tax=Lentithecium fluviatile CBS 122367 TaxID=1168545 RepID=A0A6G1IKK9_9PLEO|nr:hypothetical protein K458DRAFT_480896 [Lentithecium fluviatile CBS 122367]
MATQFDYATSKDWLDIMKNRSKLRMHELIERLGLRAKWSQNKRGKTNFESGLVRDLVTDMGDVVATLPKESDELVNFLSRKGSMKAQVDGLLEKHGTAIWGRVGDREHLISVGEQGVEDGVYPRDLYIENEEDKELIKRLLHWWLGMKAINVILARDRLDRERKKKEENKRARLELENPHEAPAAPFVALAPNAGIPSLNTNVASMVPGEPPRHMQIYQAENVSRGSPISTSMFTPPESSESPIVPGKGSIGNSEAIHFTAVNANPAQATLVQSVIEGVRDRLATVGMNGSRHGSVSSQPATNTPAWSAVNTAAQLPERRRSSLANEIKPAPPQATNVPSLDMRQLGADISKLVADLTPEYGIANGHAASVTTSQTAEEGPRNDGPYRGLDPDSLRALRAYIYREETNVTWDEDSLLRRLETAWREGVRSDHDRVLDNIPRFIARERAFLTWIELKRHLADLDRADKRWREEGTTAPEIERRIQQHRTLMGATQELMRSFEDMAAQVTGSGADCDELLRQAFVVLAGNKYAVEMRWDPIEFTTVMRWLGEHLESFQRDEEEEGEGVYFVG